MEWRTLPGSDGKTVDAAALTAWVEWARELLREHERLRVGDLQIGQVLASCPPDPDDSWPCLAVRELLERLQSPEVERGLENGIFNSLGVTTRGLFDGGQLERDRAQRYREQAERFYDSWPPTAVVLNEASDSLERAAATTTRPRGAGQDSDDHDGAPLERGRRVLGCDRNSNPTNTPTSSRRRSTT